MHLLGLFVVVCLISTTVGKSCGSTMDCTDKCSDGYHEQCVNSMCSCPAHPCDKNMKCPQGNGSGCPTFCTTSCSDGKCVCHWP